MKSRMTRQNQKLIYWLISDFAKYLKNQDHPDKRKTSEFYEYEAKQILKKKYIKHKNIKISDLKAFDGSIDKIVDILHKNATDEELAGLIMDYTITEIQKLFLEINEGFSLAIKLMSNEAAINFTNWLFDYFIYNEIPMRTEIQELYSKQENDSYIFTMLKHKKCAVCGENGADLHHEVSVNKASGYKYDIGIETPFLPLCRHHHTEIESIGIEFFRKKYLIKGIYLNKKQVEILSKVYKNHFKARKG